MKVPKGGERIRINSWTEVKPDRFEVLMPQLGSKLEYTVSQRHLCAAFVVSVYGGARSRTNKERDGTSFCDIAKLE